MVFHVVLSPKVIKQTTDYIYWVILNLKMIVLSILNSMQSKLTFCDMNVTHLHIHAHANPMTCTYDSHCTCHEFTCFVMLVFHFVQDVMSIGVMHDYS